MSQQLHKRSRFHYSGSYLSQANILQKGNFEPTLARFIDKIGLAGEHNIVLTKITATQEISDGLGLLGCSRFGVDLIYVDCGRVYIFYLEVPFGKVSENLVTRFKAAGLPAGKVPEERTYLPLGRIPNRTYVPKPKTEKPAPKVKAARIKKIPKQKKSDHVLWNILTKYKVKREHKDLLLSSLPPQDLLDNLADRAFAASDWTALAEVNSIIEAQQ